MQVTQRLPYIPPERTAKRAIEEKMKVLREFCVIDRRNEWEIEQKLINAIKAEPNKDFDIILDRVAHTLIERKLNSVQ